MIGLREPEPIKEKKEVKRIVQTPIEVSLKHQKTGEVFSVTELIIVDEVSRPARIVHPSELADQKLIDFVVQKGKNVFGKPKEKPIKEKPEVKTIR